MKKTLLTALLIVVVGISAVACSKNPETKTGENTTASKETKDTTKQEDQKGNAKETESPTDAEKTTETQTPEEATAAQEASAKEIAELDKEMSTPFTPEEALEKMDSLNTSFDELITQSQGFLDDPVTYEDGKAGTYATDYFRAVINFEKISTGLKDQTELLESNPEKKKMLSELEKKKNSLSEMLKELNDISIEQ